MEKHESSKAIIERDYSDLRAVRFFEACPTKMKHIVAPETVVETVRRINEILVDLNTYGSPQEILENAASALTLYLANPLLPHGTKACLERLTVFIKDQNKRVYNPIGLNLANPVGQALMQLEFHVIKPTAAP